MAQVTQFVTLISAALGILAVLAGVANAFAPLWGPYLPRIAAVMSGMGPHVAAARTGLAAVEKALEEKAPPLPPPDPPGPAPTIGGA